MAGNHKEWIEHGKNHPNIDHLNVTSPWDRLRDSHKTKFVKNKIAKGKPFLISILILTKLSAQGEGLY